ncbi:MAG: M18 family aminopeptidase [Deltaproteobacteria bacterium]|nr:MAG: M18 family aminopeptidase [Deltaproteobacteria bacterium]
MNMDAFNRGMEAFINASPTPWHAAANMLARLRENGYELLKESDAWHLEPGGKYVVIRNHGGLIAVRMGDGVPAETGFRIMGAHTDSPGLRIKPNPDLNSHSYTRLGVEVYGGALLNPWFDRELSIAGRVTCEDAEGRFKTVLVDFSEPVALIPSLAIHLDRGVNENRVINKQTHLPPILLQTPENGVPRPFGQILLEQVKLSVPDVVTVLGYDLCLYDVQPLGRAGLNQEFLVGGRLDNLLSCYAGLTALVESSGNLPAILVCTDHEEVGSQSVSGAQGNFLTSVLSRICPDPETYGRAMAASLLVSTDNAHGVHPNYAERHDPSHGPRLNRGPVIKINANERYATSAETAAAFRVLCRTADVPHQVFVVRSDMACGSTIGPLIAAETGVKTVDVGVPTFAMHSVRETAGVCDGYYLNQVLTAFLDADALPGIAT